MRTVADCDSLLNAAFSEVELFVQENASFAEIYQYCSSWSVASKLSWQSAQAYHIEVIAHLHP